jgi:hypothetical protein
MRPRASYAVGGHGVLAAFAAGEGEQRAAHAEAAREISEQRAVFVVGVGDDHHQAGGGGEALERLLEGGWPRSSAIGRAMLVGSVDGSSATGFGGAGGGCCLRAQKR